MAAYQTGKRLVVFHSPQQAKHNPPLEFMHGQHVPYYEAPQRIDHLLSALQAAALVQTVIEPQNSVDTALLKAVHEPDMIDYLQRMSANLEAILSADFGIYQMQDRVQADSYYYESMFPPQATKGYYIYDSVSPIGKGTWEAVHASATLAYEGAKALLEGLPLAYTLCRPPGHHAGTRFMGGYCYINNAALAAQTLKQKGRVAILDIDYHHGNGTQDIFWNDADVFVTSLHADPAVDYPFYSGYATERGGAEAEGANLNFPLPHGTDEAVYFAALQQALAAIQAFQPAALVVSLGFDTYIGDPMGKFQLELTSYTRIAQAIHALGLPTLYVQEGGYRQDALGAMVTSFFKGIFSL